jgi:hypothetical protein
MQTGACTTCVRRVRRISDHFDLMYNNFTTSQDGSRVIGTANTNQSSKDENRKWQLDVRFSKKNIEY